MDAQTEPGRLSVKFRRSEPQFELIAELALARGVDDGETLLSRLEGDLGNPRPFRPRSSIPELYVGQGPRGCHLDQNPLPVSRDLCSYWIDRSREPTAYSPTRQLF
jgi:hypothetical protein